MIELIQFPFSPFCIPQRRILEFSGAKFKIINVPPQERSLVWKLTRQKYYGVPVIRDGAKVVFDDTRRPANRRQISRRKIAARPVSRRTAKACKPFSGATSKTKLKARPSGSMTFIYRENLPAAEQLQYLRFKERKFGRGCIDQWRAQPKRLAEKTGSRPRAV